MPSSTQELLHLFDMEREGDTFSAPAPNSSALAKAFGGQYLAQALYASELHLGDASRIPHALHGSFLAAGLAASGTTVAVSTLRDGKSFSSRRVETRQGERDTFDATISFHVPEPGFSHAAMMPAVPAPDSCPSIAEAIDLTGGLGSQMWLDEWPVLDMRYAGGATNPDFSLRTREVPSSQRFWIKTRDELPASPALHRAMLAYFSDFTVLSASLIPHGYFVSTVEAPRASLNHALWIHDSARADEWLLFDQSSAWAGSGRGHGTQRIYSHDGRLIATVAQEGLIRRIPTRP